ncbi:hypothetical protein RKD29_007941 [Streptomyces tendae]|uniref:ATP-binding protein n=1 Tax=Streptomyces tendae TaxID=1932 RepID=UPI00383901E1
MSETETTHTAPAARPVVVEDDSPAGIAHARDMARAFAANLDPAPPAETAETLALVVSELATNALRHGGGRYRMHLHADADALYVAMSDLNPALPRERTPDLNGRHRRLRLAHGPPPHQQHRRHPRACTGQNPARNPSSVTTREASHPLQSRRQPSTACEQQYNPAGSAPQHTSASPHSASATRRPRRHHSCG